MGLRFDPTVQIWELILLRPINRPSEPVRETEERLEERACNFWFSLGFSALSLLLPPRNSARER